MNFIVYDLEAACWMGRPPKGINEIIEIGAIKLNGYGEVTGRFERFVKPSANPILSNFCKKLTSISQEQVDGALGYKSVIKDFMEWANVYDDDYCLCAWGDNDQLLLDQNCRWHKVDFDWNANHIDVRNQYYHISGDTKPRGLKYVVDKEGFEFTGIQHRAISDAENLAKIILKYIDEWVY